MCISTLFVYKKPEHLQKQMPLKTPNTYSSDSNDIKDCLEQNTFCAQIVRIGFRTRKKYNFSPFKK